jgi:hypothetical protein
MSTIDVLIVMLLLQGLKQCISIKDNLSHIICCMIYDVILSSFSNSIHHACNQQSV